MSLSTISWSMAAILRDYVVVVRTRPRAIPLAMITMRKSTHGFPFLSYMSMGLRLAALRAAGAPLKKFLLEGCKHKNYYYSGRVAKRSKETHEFNFLMVIMASGIARGRVHTTTTAASRKMAAMLQLIG